MKNQMLSSLDWKIGPTATKIAIVLLWCQSFDSFPQSRELDSLKLLMAKGEHSNYCDALYMTSIELMRTGYFDSAHCVVDQLYLAGEQEADSLQIVRAIAIKASIMRREGHLDSAMRMYNTALAIAKRKFYSEQSKNILNSLGLLYVLEARYDVALRYLLESLDLRQQMSDKNELTVGFHNIGFVYQKLENYDKALFYYNKALTLKEQSTNRYDVEQLLLNIGWCYVNKTQYGIAYNYFEAAFTECNETCSDKFLIDAFLGLGYIARHQEEVAKAEEHFINSYSLARKHNEVAHA